MAAADKTKRTSNAELYHRIIMEMLIEKTTFPFFTAPLCIIEHNTQYVIIKTYFYI